MTNQSFRRLAWRPHGVAGGMRNVSRVALAALMAAIGGDNVMAQPAPPADVPLSFSGRPLRDAWVDIVTGDCVRWRVSEQDGKEPGRRPLGKASETMCRELADKWVPDLSKLSKEERDSGPSAVLLDICRDVADRLAGRRVGVFWCSRWTAARFETAQEPPDDVYAALDAVPLEGAPVAESRRDRLLERVLERRMPRNPEVATHLQSIGFDCPRPAGTQPTLECSARFSELAGAASKQPLSFFAWITVTVTFGPPRPPGNRFR